PPPARPADGAWSPGGAPANRAVPPTLPGPVAPPAADPPMAKPENTASGQPWKPPPVNIPGPPVPPLPSTVPPIPPPPKDMTPDDLKKSSRSGRPEPNFALIDTLDRPWDFATSRYGSLVLMEFMTTTCVPCKNAIPVLADFQSRYGSAGLQVIAVAC